MTKMMTKTNGDDGDAISSSSRHYYGSIPIVTKLDSSEDDQQQPRATGRNKRDLLLAIVSAAVLVVLGYAASSYSSSIDGAAVPTLGSTATSASLSSSSHHHKQEHGHKSSSKHKKMSQADILTDPEYDETALFYDEQYVDHIYVDTEHNGGQIPMYSQRYYKKSKYWGGPGYPILVILGGEDALDPPMLYPFVHDGIAAKFSAFTLSPEHRFYGESQPIPKHDLEIPQDLIKYLTPDQALLDTINLITWTREQLQCSADPTNTAYCPVITFGGSYPGFLSTMLRFRFPDIVNIGYASSAPLELYSQVVDSNAYYDKVTEVADIASPGCANAVRDTMYSIRDSLIGNDGVTARTEWDNVEDAARAIGVCTDTLPHYISKYNDVFTLASEAVVYLVPAIFADFNMAFYPPNGTTSAMGKACTIFKDETTSPFDKMRLFYDLRNRVEYGDNGDDDDESTTCFDITLELPAGKGARIMGADWSGSGGGFTGEIWEFQCCKDLVIRTGYSDQSMFINRQWSYFWHKQHCHERFPGVPVEPFRMVTQWHFDDIVETGSKILFTNGMNDGWSTSSILDVQGNPDLAVINFPNGAHHSELGNTWPNDKDTDDIRAGYDEIIDILSGWLEDIPE